MKTMWKCLRDGVWVAHCLEADLCAQAGTLDDLFVECQRLATAHWESCKENGQNPAEFFTPQSVIEGFSVAAITFEVVL